MKRDEIINNMVLKATKIKEEDVIFSSDPNGSIIVRDHSHGHEGNYFVLDPSSEWAECSCAKVGQANICKHVLRVFQIIFRASDQQLVGVCHSYFGSLYGGKWTIPQTLHDCDMSQMIDFPQLEENNLAPYLMKKI